MINAIIQWIKWLADKIILGLKETWYWLSNHIQNMLYTAWNYIVDKVCDTVEALYMLIDFKEDLFLSALSLTGLPTQTIYILNKLAIGECIAMVMAAILIRVTLNLIPGAITRI